MGAIRLSPEQQTSRLAEISNELADFSRGDCSLDHPYGRVTAGELSSCVFEAIRRLEAQGRMLIDPAVKLAPCMVANFAACRSYAFSNYGGRFVNIGACAYQP